MGGALTGHKLISREQVLSVSNKLRDYFGDIVEKFEIAGSFRRGKEDIHDIDICVQINPIHQEDLNKRLLGLFGALKTDFRRAKHSGLIDGVQVEVRIAEKEYWGATLMTATGSSGLNITQRSKAKGMGMKLSEYGLFDVFTGERLAGDTETGVYRKLKLKWLDPSERSVEIKTKNRTIISGQKSLFYY